MNGIEKVGSGLVHFVFKNNMKNRKMCNLKDEKCNLTVSLLLELLFVFIIKSYNL